MVNLGSFGNEYVANSQVFFPLVITLFFLLIIFGYFYNRLMDSLRGKEHTSLYVVGGVIVTIGAAALISWKSALLLTVLFILDGIPMIAGEFKRTHRQEKQQASARRKRMPYVCNALIDEAKMASESINRLIGKAIEKEDWKLVAQLSQENTVILLKLTELKNIQINEK